jgi:hypothetical protein
MILAFGIIGSGFILQFLLGMSLIPGALLLLLGNILLLVAGTHSKAEMTVYDPEVEWVPATKERLGEIVVLDREISRWDRTALEYSNCLGGFVFFALLALFGIAITGALLYKDLPFFVFGVNIGGSLDVATTIMIDGAILLLPHWMTGTRKGDSRPDLIMKAEFFEKLLYSLQKELEGIEVQVFCRMGKSGPKDVKLRLRPTHPPPGLIGLYCQVTINRVQGKAYPFFYVVLVTKKGEELTKLRLTMRIPAGELHAESDNKGDVEFLVIRNYTTRRSGYHTNEAKARLIFDKGLEEMARWQRVRRG